MYLYQKGDYESIRKYKLEFAKEKYFNGHSDTRSVQESFDLLTSFIQDSADKHIHRKLAGRSLQFLGLHLREEGRFAGKIKLMQRQKRQAAANLDQDLKL